MGRLWRFMAIVAFFGISICAQAQFFEDEFNKDLDQIESVELNYEDGIPEDNVSNRDDILKSLDDNFHNYDETIVSSDNEEDKVVDDDIRQFKDLENMQTEAKEYDWPLDDYQHEDNRSNEDIIVEDDNSISNEDSSIIYDYTSSDEQQLVSKEIHNDNNEDVNEAIETEAKDVKLDDSIIRQSEQILEENGIDLAPQDPSYENPEDSMIHTLKEIDSSDTEVLDNEESMGTIKETEQILKQTSSELEIQNSKSEENIISKSGILVKEGNENGAEIDQDLGNLPQEEIIEDTKIILEEETDSGFKEADAVADASEAIDWGNIDNWDDINFEEPKDSDENDNTNISEIVYEKNDQSVSDENKNEKNKEFLDKEDEFYSDEETVDKVYADLQDDLDKLFKTWDKLNTDDVVVNQTEEKLNQDSEFLDVLYYEKKYGKPYVEKDITKLRIEDNDSNLGDEINDQQNNTNVDIENEGQINEPHMFSGAFIEENEDQSGLPASAKISDTSDENPLPENNASEERKPTTQRTIDVGDLSPSQYDELMKQFVALHEDELDTNSDQFDTDVAAIHLQLTTEETTVVTSPNYPSAYPTNNVVDWILEGEGMGIEFNLTDFEVNGNVGDYLLVKPGGMDAPSSNGLVFTYHLNQPRPYRFLDVDKLFIRFESHVGLTFQRGFSFTVRMVEPPQTNPEDILYPEPVLPDPTSTYTVNLGVTSVEFFLNQTESFRLLVADMATMYINANGIDMGFNTTSQITQITRTAICNINWPGFERCVQVTFAVPLVDEEESGRLTEEDLQMMWMTYVETDPFATRLRILGITEFASPDDGQVLMVWVVIASGVVIAVALLAFALWRYSCHEDYTRMSPFSDSDSVTNEKRALDLYPTPHQTLPPLYSEDYKWADHHDDSARVDMGGFTNKSYVRDELFDIDSDEDIVGRQRERYTTDV